NRWLPHDVPNVARMVTVEVDRPVIFGTLTHERTATGMKAYNSAVLTSSTGDVLGVFDKMMLLAFGETLPLADDFPALKRMFNQASYFDRGSSYRPFRMKDGTTLLPMICYEDIIPAFVRAMWNKGGHAEVLVNVTNDSWYGNTH